MKTVNVLRAMLKLAEFFGEVEQVHLYEGGVICVEGAGFSLHFVKKGETNGRAENVCKVGH